MHYFVVTVLLSAQVSAKNPDGGAGGGPSAPPENGAKGEGTQQQLAEEKPDDTQNELADLSLEELMSVQVVVTASRKEERLNAVPYAISVITKEDIRDMGARSVPEALRLAAGVDVAELSYGNAAVSPRGLHGFLSRRVLVLVDGRQIFDTLFGGTVWGAWPFQLEDIERIEVIRGPAGVTWGANAMNGAINIITKDPADQLGTATKISAGSRGTQTEYIGHAFKDDKLRLRLSGEYEGSDGFSEGGSWLGGLEDDYKAGRMSLFAIYDPNPHDTLTLSAGSSVLDGGFPRTPLGGFGWRRNPGSQATFVSGKWSHRIEKDNTLELTAYVNDFYASPGLPQIDYRYQQFAFQLGHGFRPSENHTLSWGFDTRADMLDTSNSDPPMLSRSFVSTGILGFYVQDEWRFAPQWSLNLGGRVDYEFYGGFQPSARASLVRELSDTSQVYAAVSRAFQMAPIGLRFVDFPLLNGLAWVEGDRGLDAETLFAYELGYRTRLMNRLQVGINVFWQEYDHTTTLSPRLGPPGLLTMDLDNRAAASLYGAELEARYPVSKKLTLLANYTIQRLDWRSSAPYHDTDSVSPPKNKAMIGARYSATDDLHLSSHVYYVDALTAPNVDFPFIARNMDSYLRWDMRAEYEFWKDDASFAVGVRNLTDDSHAEGGTLFLNYAEVPSMVYAEFRVRIRPQ